MTKRTKNKSVSVFSINPSFDANRPFTEIRNNYHPKTTLSKSKVYKNKHGDFVNSNSINSHLVMIYDIKKDQYWYELPYFACTKKGYEHLYVLGNAKQRLAYRKFRMRLINGLVNVKINFTPKLKNAVKRVMAK
tara:strand:- start:149 stop:550 length:402 start_codon:yes stop_codon:yes gene_type:complete